MQKKSILFGFYKGLGDFISDSYIIEYFYRNSYGVSIAAANWLEDLAKFIFPNANIVSYKEGNELFAIKYDYDYVFLSPNYLHPIDVNYKSLIFYLIKYKAVLKNKGRKTKIIKPTYFELLSYYLHLKRTYLNDHFYYMSYNLIRRYFPEIPDRKKTQNIENTNKLRINRIMIFPFSGFKPKDYPVDRYYQLAKYIKNKYGLSPEFYVVPKDKEKLKDIQNEFEVKSKSLVELAQTFDNNCLVICSDSGPGHLAAKFGANLIILYSTTRPEKYKPIGNGKIFTIKSKTQNIKEITTEQIIKKIENFSFGV